MSGGRGGEKYGCRCGSSITHQGSISCTTNYKEGGREEGREGGRRRREGGGERGRGK